MFSSLTLSDSAARRIRHLAERQGDPALFLRLAVDSGGCSGFKYSFDLGSALNAAEDVILEKDGARLVVDKTSLEYVKGGVVDFTSDLSGERFLVTNPNADSSCGCGVSFSMTM